MTAVKPRRRYDSSRRQEQAAQTRESVLAAALRLFSEGGWTSTTIAAIARSAGVSKETIYAVWGTKAAIAAELVQRAIRGAQPDVPLLDQVRQKGLSGSARGSGEAKIDAFANDVSEILSRVAPLVDAIRTAGGSDAESAALYSNLHEGRRRNLRTVAEDLAPNLRRHMSVDDATEHIWREASPELYLLLTRQAGYDNMRYAEMLAGTLKRLLL